MCKLRFVLLEASKNTKNTLIISKPYVQRGEPFFSAPWRLFCSHPLKIVIGEVRAVKKILIYVAVIGITIAAKVVPLLAWGGGGGG